jgi:hypothetical protein
MFSNQNFICIAYLSHSFHVPCPSHIRWLYLRNIKLFCEEYKSWSLSSCNFLHPAVTSFILVPGTVFFSASCSEHPRSVYFTFLFPVCSKASFARLVSRGFIYLCTCSYSHTWVVTQWMSGSWKEAQWTVSSIDRCIDYHSVGKLCPCSETENVKSWRNYKTKIVGDYNLYGTQMYFSTLSWNITLTGTQLMCKPVCHSKDWNNALL